MVKRFGVVAGLLLVAFMVVFSGSALAAPPNPPGGYGAGFLDRVTLQRVAALLALTPADITAQIQQGKTLLQVAQSKNVGEQALTDTILQPVKDRLALQVKYGYLTQEQADLALQNQQARTKSLISSSATDNGYGGWRNGGVGGMMGGFGGMMGGFGGMMSGFGGMMSGFGGMMGGFGGGNMMSRW